MDAQLVRAPHVDNPTPTAYPRRVPGTHFDSQQAPQPVAEPPAPAPTVEPPQPLQRQSVFEDIGSVTDPMLGGSGQGAPTLPSTGAPQIAAGGAPILPDAVPAPPPVAEPAGNGPDNNDITALRSAQMRASRQQRQGRLFGRSLLAFVLIGGVLGAGLYFGRSLLFSTDWDAQLTPIVNELQDTSGVEFDEAVPVVAVPAAQYAERVSVATIGADWVGRVPEWRALGLATGDVSANSVGAMFAGTTSAFYDPDSRTIYQVDGAPSPEADLRLALTQALDHQQSQSDTPSVSDTASDDAGPDDEPDPAAAVDPIGTTVEARGFTGVSPLPTIATRAVDHLMVAGNAGARQPASETLPVPIAYEVAAVDHLGEPILIAAGVDPSTLVPGMPYPDSVTGALDDRPVDTASGLLQPGEVSLAEPVALGIDDWSLVWAARLPAPVVDGLVTQVVADSYRPIRRDGTVCFIGVFQSSDDVGGAAVLAAMQSWVANSPVTAQAVATSLGATRVQLQACDPGAADPTAPNAGVVDGLIDRQQLRLTN